MDKKKVAMLTEMESSLHKEVEGFIAALKGDKDTEYLDVAMTIIREVVSVIYVTGKPNGINLTMFNAALDNLKGQDIAASLLHNLKVAAEDKEKEKSK